MRSINPYLNFNGRTEEAFNFYKSVFGGEFTALQRFSEMPDGDKLSSEDKNKIMHASLSLGKGITLMATDILESMGMSLIVGNNTYISINTESEEETERIFNRLSVDGIIEMPLQKTFWNAYYGILRDKFGVQWMVNFDYSK